LNDKDKLEGEDMKDGKVLDEFDKNHLDYNNYVENKFFGKFKDQ